MKKLVEDPVISKIKRPRGTRDFMPKEMLVRRKVEQVLRSSFEKFGYQEISTPIFENIELFEIRSGEKFRDDVYHFIGPTKERDEDGGSSTVEYCLRPELTAPTCRFFVSGDLGATPKPLKAYYIGPCFRYDKPAPGRYREFYQAGIELFGSKSIKADAEIITIAAIAVKSLGISKFQLKINDLLIIREFLETIGLSNQQNQILGIIDSSGSAIAKQKLNPLDNEKRTDLIKEFKKNLFDLSLNESIIDILVKLLNLKGKIEVLDTVKEIFKEYPSVLETIKNSGLNYVFEYLNINGIKNIQLDFSIARGLDYYTGIVFEIDVNDLGSQKQVCGGGRYDNLIAEYGGHDTPGTGFAMGLDRLVQCVELFKTPILPKTFEQSRADVFLKVFVNDFATEIKIATELRNAGIRVEIDQMNRGLGKSLNNASKLKIPLALILGKQELGKKLIQLRNLTSDPWTQELINFEKEIMIREVKKALNEFKKN